MSVGICVLCGKVESLNKAGICINCVIEADEHNMDYDTNCSRCGEAGVSYWLDGDRPLCPRCTDQAQRADLKDGMSKENYECRYPGQFDEDYTQMDAVDFFAKYCNEDPLDYGFTKEDVDEWTMA